MGLEKRLVGRFTRLSSYSLCDGRIQAGFMLKKWLYRELCSWLSMSGPSFCIIFKMLNTLEPERGEYYCQQLRY